MNSSDDAPRSSSDSPRPEGPEPPPRGTRVAAVVRWLLVAAMAGAAAMSFLATMDGPVHAEDALYTCPMHPEIKSATPGKCPICGMNLVPKAKKPKAPPLTPASGPASGPAGVPASVDASLAPEATDASSPVYTHECPMHPEVRSEGPGACPICGMFLTPIAAKPMPPKTPQRSRPTEPIPEPPPLHRAPVTLTMDRVQLLGVKSRPAVRRPIASEVRVTGTLQVAEDRLFRLDARFGGWVEVSHVARAGELVERDQALAGIFSPELLAAQHELLGARQHQSHDLLEAARRRLEISGVPTDEIARIEARGEASRVLPVRSPIKGTVLEKRIRVGERIDVGTRLFEIADLSSLYAVVDIPETESRSVEVGSIGIVKIPARSDREIRGRVIRVGPQAERGSRFVPATIELPNPSGVLLPGNSVEVVLRSAESNALVVDLDSIIFTGKETYVFVDQGNGRFEARAVTIGRRDRGLVEVARGLEEGDEVVTTGAFLLDSESRLDALSHGSTK